MLRRQMAAVSSHGYPTSALYAEVPAFLYEGVKFKLVDLF